MERDGAARGGAGSAKEGALPGSDGLFRRMFESSPTGIVLVSPDFHFLEVNPAFCAMLGYDPAELVGKSFQDVSFPEDRAVGADLARDVLAGRADSFQLEKRYVRKDGSIVWGLVNAALVRGADGAPLHFVTQIQDVTSRKRAELALERERDLLQSVMNGAKNSHLVFLDRDFNFVRVNAAYAATCGYSPEEMIGKNHFVLYPNAENQVIFERVRDSGEPFEIRDKPFEFPDQRERGTTNWDWTLTPVKGSDGRVEGLVFSLFETTGRVRAEEALRESEARYRTLFDASPVGTALVDASGVIREANKALLTLIGTSREDLVGRGFVDLVGAFGLDVEHHLEDFEKRLHGGDPMKELDFVNRSGERKTVSVRSVSLKDGVAPAGVLFMLDDITERRRAESELRREHENFLRVFSAAPVGLLLLDEETVIRDANAAVAALVLREPAEIIGQRGGGGLRCVHGDDDPRGCGFGRACAGCPLRAAIESALRTGRSAHGVEVRAELVVGDEAQERWLTVNAEPIRIDDRLHLVVAVDDITERKRIEAAAAESEAQYRALFAQAADGIMMMSVEDGCVVVNESFARMHGYSPEEMATMRLSDLDAPETARLAPERLRRLVEGEPMSFEVEHIHRNGHVFPLSVSCNLVHVGGKRYLLGFHNDLTDRQRAERQIRAQLEELQRWQDVMLDREDRVQELKREVNELCRRLGGGARYPSQDGQGAP